MKKIMFLTILYTSIKIFSQVGVGTKTPSSTLDLVYDNTSTFNSVLKVRNHNGQEVMSVDNKGNLFFKQSLHVSNSSGFSGNMLASKGDNEKVEWVEANQTVTQKYVTIGFNSFTNVISPILNQNTNYPIDFISGTIVVNSSEIGSWNAMTFKYTVNKAGIYEVLVAVKADAINSTTDRRGVLVISMGNFTQRFLGSNVIGSNTGVNYTGKVSRFLLSGATIYVEADMSTSWRYDNSIININYSPKTN